MSDNIYMQSSGISLENFNCQICLEVSVSPNYTCANLHIICGICKEKITNCPSCQDINLTVNPLVERLLKSNDVTIPCRYDCPLQIKPHEMMEHLKTSCDYRKIKCMEVSGCDYESYTPFDLSKHWLSVHKITAEIAESYDSEFLVSGSYHFGGNTYQLLINHQLGVWPPILVKLEDKQFFCHALIKEGDFRIWMTMMGSEKDANMYKYSVIVSSVCSNSKEKQIAFHGLPVHCLQYYDYQKVCDLGHTATVSLMGMKFLHDTSPTDKECKFMLDVNIQISKSSE